jgi:hypothetical protein
MYDNSGMEISCESLLPKIIFLSLKFQKVVWLYPYEMNIQ